MFGGLCHSKLGLLPEHTNDRLVRVVTMMTVLGTMESCKLREYRHHVGRIHESKHSRSPQENKQTNAEYHRVLRIIQQV